MIEGWWSSALDSSTDWGHYVVFLGKILYSHILFLHPGVNGTGELSGQPDKNAGRGVAIRLVASCYGKGPWPDKLLRLVDGLNLAMAFYDWHSHVVGSYTGLLWEQGLLGRSKGTLSLFAASLFQLRLQFIRQLNLSMKYICYIHLRHI